MPENAAKKKILTLSLSSFRFSRCLFLFVCLHSQDFRGCEKIPDGSGSRNGHGDFPARILWVAMDDRISDNLEDREADPIQRRTLKPGPRGDLERALSATSMLGSLEFSVRNVVCVAR
jgi:hypothetical protein